MPIGYYSFKINEKPFAVWGDIDDLKKESLNYIENVETDLFRYQMEFHLAELRKNPENMNAAISIRQTYFHALETFLSLLSSALQATEYPLGWILKYSNQDLRSFINKINNNEKIFNFHKLNQIDWVTIGHLIHRMSYHSEDDMTRINRMLDYWKKWGFFHVNENSILEYNSLKHGYRTKFGSTKLTIGNHEIEPGKYGLNYSIAKSFNNNKELKLNFYTDFASSNWNPFRNSIEILLISCSIVNVKAFLLPYLAQKELSINYEIPKNEWFEELEKEKRPALINLNLTKAIKKIDTSELKTREELNKILEKFE